MFSKTLPKTFLSLVKNNTRKEFNSKFEVREIEVDYWALCYKDGTEIIPCPPGNKDCQILNKCEKCWLDTIQKCKFKDEIY